MWAEAKPGTISGLSQLFFSEGLQLESHWVLPDLVGSDDLPSWLGSSLRPKRQESRTLLVNIPCVPLRAGVRGRIRPGPDLRQLQARAGAGIGRQTLWEGVWVREKPGWPRIGTLAVMQDCIEGHELWAVNTGKLLQLIGMPSHSEILSLLASFLPFVFIVLWQFLS